MMGTIIKFPDRTSGRRRPPVAFIGIDYDEFHPETYRGVFVDFNDGERLTFQSYGAAVIYAGGLGMDICNLSSVDNFCADVEALRGEA